MIPVKATGWFNSALTQEDQSTLTYSGLVPVNDIFFDLWDDQSKIKLLYGSYGSGKSDFVATWLLKECQKKEYFKGFYGRKVYDKVRQSCHSKLVSIIKRHKLESKFSFSEQPNGSMIIAHNETGNKLIPYGAADPDDMKSVDDPT